MESWEGRKILDVGHEHGWDGTDEERVTSKRVIGWDGCKVLGKSSAVLLFCFYFIGAHRLSELFLGTDRLVTSQTFWSVVLLA